MKIVNILGGLGNQMFQYAFALALKQRWPDDAVAIDTAAFRGYPLHNGYELDRIFNLTLPIATPGEVWKVNYPTPHYRLWQFRSHILEGWKVTKERESMVFQQEALDTSGPRYYEGYWQSERYLKEARDLILREFKFPSFDGQNLALADSIRGKTSVAVHVRRGDYLKSDKFRGLADLDYYRRAFNHMIEETNPDIFLIFSNDIDWCRENIGPLSAGREVVYVDWNTGADSYRDMQLMSICDHCIIPNSTFSWWGAWLNQNPAKTVVAPKYWSNFNHHLDIIPDSWIRI